MLASARRRDDHRRRAAKGPMRPSTFWSSPNPLGRLLRGNHFSGGRHDDILTVARGNVVPSEGVVGAGANPTSSRAVYWLNDETSSTRDGHHPDRHGLACCVHRQRGTSAIR
jgi:hypothetical protein